MAQCGGLSPYQPGKPIDALLREHGIANGIKLASNENPWGPPPRAIEAIKRHAAHVHRYPDGDGTELKKKLAHKWGVEPANILLGNGSNELIELVIRTFAGKGDNVVFPERAFIVYRLAATAAGASCNAVNEKDGYAPDLDGLAEAVDASTKVVCLANPNNPTGSLVPLEALQGWLDRLPRDVIVLLDEAYYEYVTREYGDSIASLRHPGLVFTRTFSKAYGLAGLRIGYALGDACILELVNRFREPFNVNALAQVAALAALEDEMWVMQHVEQCLDERERLERHLSSKGLLAAHSKGNFVLLRHPKSAWLLRNLERCGIIVRPLGPYGMEDVLRISVGTREENDRFLRALDGLLGGRGA